jgi:hypothetical protein
LRFPLYIIKSKEATATHEKQEPDANMIPRAFAARHTSSKTSSPVHSHPRTAELRYYLHNR